MGLEKEKYLCFLDESGQPSLSENSSKWFFLTAVVFPKNRRTSMLAFFDSCIDLLFLSCDGKPPKDGLHWRKLSHERKMALAKKYSEISFCQINICFWKEKFTRPKKIRDNHFYYRYASKLAIERISWYVDDLGGNVDITFSDRTNFSKSELKKYIDSEMHKSESQIRPVFDPQRIEIKTYSDERLLQLADNCASSFANAFEPNRFGDISPFYAEEFIDKFYFYNGKTLWKYGIKVMPHDNVTRQDFINAYPFTKKGFIK